MGLEGLFPGRRTSLTESGAKAYPYLLRDRTLTRINEVWISVVS
jgi:hypothetical protein